MASILLVAIIDSDRKRRDTVGAILDIELGLSFVAAGSLADLATELEGRSPQLIIVGSGRSSSGEDDLLRGIDDRYPYVPLIVIDGAAWGRHATLPIPIDATKLVDLVLELLAE